MIESTNCETCNKTVDLAELVRTLDNYKGFYHCVECHTKAHEGKMYPPAFPLMTRPAQKQIRKLNKLLRWAFG